MMVDGLRLSGTRSLAFARWRRFRLLLATALALHLLMGLLALLVPRVLAGWLGTAIEAGEAGWIRAFGATLVAAATMEAAGLFQRLRGRWAIGAAILHRLLLALACAPSGGGLLILAAAETAFALGLASLYLHFAKAELMSRP